MKKFYLIITLTFILIEVSAQQWDVPEDKKAKVSSFKFNTETSKKGQIVFQRNCLSCHGEPTKGNFVPLTPVPGDPATDKFQKQTDGALFYKITTGRSPMPQFKDILTEEERWEVIAYIRSFNKNYIQPAIASGKQTANTPQVNLDITYVAKTKQVRVSATDTLKKPLSGIEISLFVKRYFGSLPVNEAISTNNNGIALFSFPGDIPGDKDGSVELIVKVSSEKNGDSQKSMKLAIGIPANNPPLTQARAMWNIGIKAPVWLLLIYTVVVLGIWGFVFYIVFQLIKMKKTVKKSHNI